LSGRHGPLVDSAVTARVNGMLTDGLVPVRTCSLFGRIAYTSDEFVYLGRNSHTRASVQRKMRCESSFIHNIWSQHNIGPIHRQQLIPSTTFGRMQNGWTHTKHYRPNVTNQSRLTIQGNATPVSTPWHLGRRQRNGTGPVQSRTG